MVISPKYGYLKGEHLNLMVEALKPFEPVLGSVKFTQDSIN